MNYLLDTHLLLWFAEDSPRLPNRARDIIGDRSNGLLFSVASLWEITTKFSRGRADFDVDARELREGLIENGFGELSITSEHAFGVAQLPWLHRDPIDRLLLAQAIHEQLWLLTSDRVISRYGGPIVPV